MTSQVLNISRIVSTLASAVSVMYCILCIWAGIRFASQRRRAHGPASGLPPVSILKPLKGTDPEIYASLRSHCVLNYPQYEILFGVTHWDDPAIPVVERLIAEFPDRAIRLVRCDKELGANGKVRSLVQLAAVATHDFFLVNDSDIRVEPTLAFRRRELQAIGGFEAIVDYLADDYELGSRIAARSFKVKLSEFVVETYLPAYNMAGFFSHQLRWARTIRASRAGGYAGLLFTFTLPWAVLTFILARGASWAWGLLVAALAARVAMALVTSQLVLCDRGFLRWFWLLPFRDFLAVVIWLGGLAGRKIVWRGEAFDLKNGKLTRSD